MSFPDFLAIRGNVEQLVRSLQGGGLGFESLNAHHLEKVVRELESGDLPLDRSLELFSRGVALSDSCRKQLEDAETRVETLIRREGAYQTEPFRAEK